MRFQVLGPLEAADDDGVAIPLGGVKQRATLGFLLLRPNQVVATSQLLTALWSRDDPPASARKMLQNAVWGLRSALSSGSSGRQVALLTQAPGYMLQLDQERIDLFLFHRKAEEGRALLAAGSADLAATVLRAALDTWRGAALADLVESGISWSELAAVERARLTTMEDYFDAQLACGRHHGVLAELEAMVETEKLRERCCGQLMVALYRCGRHADALNVYSRVRATLVEDLGLEPGPELQRLQQAILSHDPALALPNTASNSRPITLLGTVNAAAVAPAAVTPVTDPELPGRAPEMIPLRRTISLAIVRARLRADLTDLDPIEIDNLLAGVTSVIKVGIERLGGTVAASIGSATLALFESRESGAHDPHTAVRATLTLRDCLSPTLNEFHSDGEPGVTLQAAVVTGEALVRHHADDHTAPPTLDGALVDRCQSLLSEVGSGEVWICDDTRDLIGPSITCGPRSDQGNGWRVDDVRGGQWHAEPTLAAEHESELAVMSGLLERTRHRCRPHLVTVLSDAAAPMAQFLDEFESRVGTDRPEATFLYSQPACPKDTGLLSAQATVLAALCGLRHTDSPETVREKVVTAVRCVSSDREADRLLARLIPLAVSTPTDISSTLAAWRRFLELTTHDRPVVVVMDDLHRASEHVLDSVESLAESSGSVCLLVVATARPELLSRRPNWGGGKLHAASITLDSAAQEGTRRFRRSVLSMVDKQTRSTVRRILSSEPIEQNELSTQCGRPRLAVRHNDSRVTVPEARRHTAAAVTP